MYGLYIHTPFCWSKCRYCDFYRETLSSSAEEVDAFLDALLREFSLLPENFSPKTVFLGGGTPTALSSDQLARLLDGLRERVRLSEVEEFSCEANPGTLSLEKLNRLRAGGVNRISLGIQSFNENHLHLLGRIHSAEEAKKAVYMARESGFKNLSLDLIQGIPNSTLADVEKDLSQAVELHPEHLSCYNLSYEPSTPLGEDLANGKVVEIGDEIEAEIYFFTKHFLENAGYKHYEISNYAKPKYTCQHNLLYWTGGAYWGCGPAAHSHWDQVRWGNTADLKKYITALEKNQFPQEKIERLSSVEKAKETLVMHLRLLDGVDLQNFKQQTGFDLFTLCGDQIRHLEEEGLLERKEHRIRLSSDALFISNAVFSELI